MAEHALFYTLREAARRLPESGIVEVVNYGRERPGLIPLWVGEGDLPTPAFIQDATVAALREGHTFYTYQRGIPALREAIADYYARHYEFPLDWQRVIVTGSGMQGIMSTMQALVGADDEVVVVSPVWPNVYAAVELQEARWVPVTLDYTPHGWSLDLDKLFDAVTPRTRALFINSPGNPTGWVLSEAEMLAIRDFARQRGLWLVADEVYGRFVYDRPRMHSFLEIMEPEEPLVVCNTFSKNWSMTGWRVGWVVIPAVLGQLYENLVQYNTSGTARFMQEGALAAIRDGDDYVTTLVERCRQGRDIVCGALGQLPNVRFASPAGAFYLFFQVEGEHDCIRLAKRLVDEANVGLAPGRAFGPGGERFLRLCFAASHATLEEGVGRLVAALRPR